MTLKNFLITGSSTGIGAAAAIHLAKLGHHVSIKTAVPTDQVSHVIEHALLSDKPKIYYPVGRGAKIQAAMSHLVPQNLMDKLIRKTAGLDY